MPNRSAPSGPPSQRQLRAGEIIRHALAEIISREDFRDPDLSGVIVTVGEVRCSPDLRHASVFVTPLGDMSEEGRAKLALALTRARGFLRTRLGREIRMKFTPELHFVADESYDKGLAIDRLLADPKVRQDVERAD